MGQDQLMEMVALIQALHKQEKKEPLSAIDRLALARYLGTFLVKRV